MRFENTALKNCLNRIEAGDRNIAISNMGHIGTQQKYLISIIAYLSSKEEYKDKKIGLVSFQLEYGLYKSFFSNMILIHKHDYITPSVFTADFIDWNYLLSKGMYVKDLNDYDILLWDLPELHFIQNHSTFLESFFRKFDSMMIITLRPNGLADLEHLNRIQAFYEAHGLKIPKLISNDEDQKETNKISKFFGKIVGF